MNDVSPIKNGAMLVFRGASVFSFQPRPFSWLLASVRGATTG